MKAKPISPEQAAQLEQATIRNIVDKVGSGGIPTARELDMLREATAEPPPDAKQAETFGPRLNIRQLARLTGKTRETIGTRLAGLAPTVENGHKLFDTQAALELIYIGTAAPDGSITEAESRRRLNIAKTRNLELDDQIKRKERVTLEAVEALNTAALTSIAAIIKSRLGKRMDLESINQMFEQLRAVELQVDKWKAERISPTATPPPKKRRRKKSR